MKVLQKYYLHNQKCKWNHWPQHSHTTEESLVHKEEWVLTPDTWLDLKMMTEARHTSPHSVRVHLYKISTEAEHRQGVTGAGKGSSTWGFLCGNSKCGEPTRDKSCTRG